MSIPEALLGRLLGFSTNIDPEFGTPRVAYARGSAARVATSDAGARFAPAFLALAIIPS